MKQNQGKKYALLLQLILTICLLILIGWLLDKYVGRWALGLYLVIVLVINIDSIRKSYK